MLVSVCSHTVFCMLSFSGHISLDGEKKEETNSDDLIQLIGFHF